MSSSHQSAQDVARSLIQLFQAGREDEAKRLYAEPALREAIIRCVKRVEARQGATFDELRSLVELKLWENLTRRNNYDPSRPFEPWCYQTVQNAARDLWRDERKHRRVMRSVNPRPDDETRNPLVEAPDPTTVEEHSPGRPPCVDLEEPFTPEDLTALRNWPLEDRVLVLAVFDLYRKVPPCDWKGWLEELGFDEQNDFTAEIRGAESHKRLALVGALLGLSANTAQQRWARRRHWIVRLKWFWTEALANHWKFSAKQLELLMKVNETLDRIVIVCLTPNWFRAPSLEMFAEIVELPLRRADFPWLRFFPLESTFDARKQVLAGTSCGLGLDSDDIQKTWEKHQALRSQLQV